MNASKPSLQLRALTSVLIAVTFLALGVSGAILFLSPPGRVANWSDWRMLGLTKHDWTGLHVWFSVIFLVTAGFHIVFNFRPLVNYFKDRLTRRIGFRREWIVAFGLCAGVFVGVRAGVPPFSSFLDFNEGIKRSWEDPRGAAPIPHAELLSLKELAGKAEVPLDTALQRLTEKGVQGQRRKSSCRTWHPRTTSQPGGYMKSCKAFRRRAGAVAGAVRAAGSGRNRPRARAGNQATVLRWAGVAGAVGRAGSDDAQGILRVAED